MYCTAGIGYGGGWNERFCRGVLEFDGKPAVRSSSGKFSFHRRGDRRLLDALVMAYETAIDLSLDFKITPMSRSLV